MSARIEALAARIAAHFGEQLKNIPSTCGELTYEVAASELIAIATTLRDGEQFKFDQLVDLTGVDLLTYGQVEWSTQQSTRTGFSRGVVRGARVDRLCHHFRHADSLSRPPRRWRSHLSSRWNQDR